MKIFSLQTKKHLAGWGVVLGLALLPNLARAGMFSSRVTGFILMWLILLIAFPFFVALAFFYLIYRLVKKYSPERTNVIKIFRFICVICFAGMLSGIIIAIMAEFT